MALADKMILHHGDSMDPLINAWMWCILASKVFEYCPLLVFLPIEVDGVVFRAHCDLGRRVEQAQFEGPLALAVLGGFLLKHTQLQLIALLNMHIYFL